MRLSKDRRYRSNDKRDSHGEMVSVGYRGHGNMMYIWLTHEAISLLGVNVELHHSNNRDWEHVNIEKENLDKLRDIIDSGLIRLRYQS